MLILLFLVGCEYRIGNKVQPEAPGYDQATQALWKQKVAGASVIWRDALGCIDPFPLDGDGPELPIVLLTPDEWPHGDGNIGMAPADYIEIKGPNVGDQLGLMTDVILHEMGHIMRLGHSSNPTSVMRTPVNGIQSPNERDVESAREYACP